MSVWTMLKAPSPIQVEISGNIADPHRFFGSGKQLQDIKTFMGTFVIFFTMKTFMATNTSPNHYCETDHDAGPQGIVSELEDYREKRSASPVS